MKRATPDLELLIKHFEAEKKSLKRMIKNAAAEGDNLIVYYHSETLLELERHLDVLKGFEDPYYGRKKALRWRIDMMKNMPLNQFSERLRDHMKKRHEDRVSELRADLQKLIDKPATKVYNSTHIIDDALFSLYERQCKSFKLLIREEEGFGLQFKLRKTLLIITLIGEIWDDEPDFIIDSRVSKKLEGMGFLFDAPRKKYFRAFDLTGFKEVAPIKQWVARFIVDYCGMYSFSQNVRLIYQ